MSANVRVADVVIACAAVGFDAVVFRANPEDGVAWRVLTVSDSWQIAVGLAALPLLVFRRRSPLVVCVALGLFSLVQTIVVGTRPLVSLLVALYAAAASCTSAAAGLALATVLLAHSVTVAYESTVKVVDSNRLVSAAATALAFALLDLGAWGFGRRTSASRRREKYLEENRAALAAHAVAQERLRIAHELHDIVAHSVTVMVLQAAGARRFIETEPSTAGEAMQLVEDVGKQAMTEMRRMLSVLRSVHEGPVEASRLGLSALTDLTQQVEAIGIRVEVENHGMTQALDPSVDLAAYRVIQESLTNVTRHAGPGSFARVALTWSEHMLTIEVDDDGAGERPAEASSLSSGFGLVGLGERVKLMGGKLSTGRLPDSGYRVSAELPTAAS
jgi:signal transduction histidine kinase